MCLRTWAASVTTSRPATLAEPRSGRSSVASTRTAVVLPAPFGPSMPRIEPRGTSRSTPSSALVLPNVFSRPIASSAMLSLMGSLQYGVRLMSYTVLYSTMYESQAHSGDVRWR